MFNPNFGLSPTPIKGRWEEIFITQDFDDNSDLDNSTDFKFNNFNMRVFIANSPWKDMDGTTDQPFQDVNLFLGMSPVTKSWLNPFSFIKRLEDLQKEKTGKDFKLSEIEWEVNNLTTNDGSGKSRNGMLYINRAETQDGLKRMTDMEITSYNIPELNEIK